MGQKKRVLISGASFAGLTTAYWMNKLGHEVTIIEIGGQLKKGGTPVDIKERTVDIVKNMGLFEQILAQRIGPEKWEFKNTDDLTGFSIELNPSGIESSNDEFEIERDTLLDMLFLLIRDDVEFLFNNSIAELHEDENHVEAMFKDGSKGQYEFVFGCDGIHSAVRKLWFGNESDYVRFLGQYFSIAVVDKLLVENGTYQMYVEPNKCAALYAHSNKTDVIFTFRPGREIAYDFRNQLQLKDIVTHQMQTMKWRSSELLEEMLNSESFYFDKFCQVKMPSWTKGRVALVGDAAYCASPAAGMGGSLAIIGADALGKAFEKHKDDYQSAFEAYNRDLRPYIEQIQAMAVVALDKLLPSTEKDAAAMWKNGIAF